MSAPPHALSVFLAIASMFTYLYLAAAIRRRALEHGRTSVARATGPARWLPFFIFVPYVVMAARVQPELDVPDALRWIGLALIVGGPAFSYWSAATLGRHFDLDVEIHAGHEIVVRGPYRIVRHPVYLGIAIHFVGACLATGTGLIILGTLVVTFPALYLRAAAEERLLRSRLGPAYDAYARRVPMLIPAWKLAPCKRLA
ncbi:MAG TPA: isoprenylcysteine carboxylmethyltransferase family protein [Candidatus Limnocylindria bacterium]|nr:isoprenylcysteine carboxylmethyltransferase family protein [Candidatus Limnocylindria bacterium]